MHLLSSVLVILIAATLAQAPARPNKTSEPSENEFKQTPSTKQALLRNNTLKDSYSCKEYANCSHPQKVCSCLPSCELFNNCCNLDFERISFTETQRLTASVQKTCMRTAQTERAWIINGCPYNITADVIPDAMAQLNNILPVMDGFNISYLNRSVAHCNGVLTYTPWRFSFTSLHNCRYRNAEPGSPVAEPIMNIITSTNLSTPSLVDLLLESKCYLDFFPPDGRTGHYCRNFNIQSQGCSPIFQPVFDKDENKQIFHNLECCKKNQLCKTGFRCIMKPVTVQNPFVISRGHLLSMPSMILFDLSEMSQRKDVTVQYLNMEYERKFVFDVSNRIDKDSMISMYCLLKQYFESMKNAVKIDESELTLYRTQNGSESFRYVASFWFLFNSQRIFEDIDEAKRLRLWLEYVKVRAEIREESKHVQFRDLGYTPSVNTSELELVHQLLQRGRQLAYFKFVSLSRSPACRYLATVTTSPRGWCSHLDMEITATNGTYSVIWHCTAWDTKLKEQQLVNIARRPCEILCIDIMIGLFLLHCCIT